MTQFAPIYLQDNTSRGTVSTIDLDRWAWALRYQGLYQHNRSPWVEHGYDVFALEDLRILPKGATVPDGGWLFELVDVSDQPGALGWHEDSAFHVSKVGASGVHSVRGLAAGTEVPKAVICVKTSQEDGVAASEVASHELCEALVDPYVMDEGKIRKYLNKAKKEWWIGEVGDPVQGRGYDVGAPEGRTTGVIVADEAYPRLWGQDQRRAACSFTEDVEAWLDGRTPNSGLEPWTLAPEGYMSEAPEDEPTNWTQIFGSKKARAEQAAAAYERPGDLA